MRERGTEGDVGLRLACGGLAWLAGVALQLHQPALWPPIAYAGLLALGAVALGAGLHRRLLAPVIAGAMLLGLASAGMRAADRLAESLDPQLEGEDLLLTGVVASLPQAGSAGVRFRFAVEQALWRGRVVQVPDRIALGWYRGWHEDAQAHGPQDALRAGQRWRFTVRLRRPHGSVNPHGFDYELWLFEQGVRATGYVRVARDAVAEPIADAAGYPVERWRQQVRDAIHGRVSDARAAGVLAALVVGDQAAIERDDWQLFRNTGVAHLMSISGLHVTMFAWLAALAIGAAWKRGGSAMLLLPAVHAARWGGLLAALGYAVFSGWGVPAQRTVWMLGTAALLATLGRRWPWPLVLLAAGVVVTVFDPWALLQPGFWLSFVAVGLLMVAEPVRLVHGARSAVRGVWRRGADALITNAASALRAQTVATLGLTPLTLVLFQQVSLVGLLANLIAIPLVTLVVTPLALLGAIAPPLWSAGALLVAGLTRGLSWLAELPVAVWTAPVAPAWAQAAGLVAGVLAILPIAKRLRLLALPLALPLLWPVVQRPADGAFEVVAADVGQGNAVLVRTREHLLVYDTGPQYAPGSDAGQRVLLPLLRARGERRIDRLVLSHRDNDHVGGAGSLLASLPVLALTSSLEPGHELLPRVAEASRCEAGQRWSWDGVRFEVLHPPAEDYARQVKPNALSCVLRIEGRGASALLAGDIEREQEEALVSRFGHALKSDVLLVPHHGSRTSSTPALLEAVQPRTAVVQAGYRNRFGHPAPDVVARYAEHGITLVQSASCGAWTYTEAGGSCERARSLRYWRRE